MKSPSHNPDSFPLDSADSMGPVIISNILDSMSDSLLVLGEDGEILYANSVTEQVLGYHLADFRKRGARRSFFFSRTDPGFQTNLPGRSLEEGHKELP